MVACPAKLIPPPLTVAFLLPVAGMFTFKSALNCELNLVSAKDSTSSQLEKGTPINKKMMRVLKRVFIVIKF